METEAKLFIQSEIKFENIELYWSYILSYENSKNNDLMKKNTIDKWRIFSKKIIEPSTSIDSLSEKINDIGIKEIDSLHLACAIDSRCDYFITTDKGILKKAIFIPEIKILSTIDFVGIYMEDKNDD